MENCLDEPPVCTSNKPIVPITNQALCVVSTYTTGTLKCPLRAASIAPQPFLHFQGNQLFFSVPHNVSAYVKCQTSTLSNEYTEKTIMLHGIGQGEYKPSCTINLPDGTSYKTPSDKIVTKLQEWPIFHLQQAIPHNLETTLHIKNSLSDFSVEQQQEQQDQSSFEFLAEYTKADIIGITFSTTLPILLIILIIGCWCYRTRRQRIPTFSTDRNNNTLQPPLTQVWFTKDGRKNGSPILHTTQL